MSSSHHKYKRKSRSRSRQRRQSRSPSPQVARYRIEPTHSFSINNAPPIAALQPCMTEISIAAGTSIPDQIVMNESTAYIHYPSVQCAKLIMEKSGKVLVAGKQYKLHYFPVKKVDLNAVYDWYCEKCEYKNFGRRSRCYRCEEERTEGCKLAETSSVSHPPSAKQEQSAQNCSLMIRGPIITSTSEEILLDLFEGIAAVKDIRLIRNKLTNKYKDFAFIEFYSPQQTAAAYKMGNQQNFRVKGQKVNVMYSRNKVQQDWRHLPFDRQKKRQGKKRQFQEQPNAGQSYYRRQRQMQIQQQKSRPIITIQQLKQKKQQQLKKQSQAQSSQALTEDQIRRKQAQQLAKSFQRDTKKDQAVLYVCVLCRRKFKGQPQMKQHQEKSLAHKWRLKQH